MLHLHRSNRAERLVDALAEVVRAPLADPLATELVAVQSRGIEQWLAMELSHRLGVWAQSRFPFPRHLIESLFDAVLGDASPERSAFDEGALAWAIAKLLPARLGDARFAPVARYLEGDDDGVRVLELAERIAGVFDDYIVYRPELVLEWERQGGDDWQATLFRELVSRHGGGHQAVRAQAFVERLANGNVGAEALPARVSVFGIATLPPLHLSVLDALARRVEVHLFVLAPSREYFADATLPRGDEAVAPPSAQPLLASLGRLGREFQRLLEERTGYLEDGEGLFVDPGTVTALAALQSDMLCLRRRGEGGDAPRLVLARDDDSIAVHACHGPMREVEVLHDALVALLEDRSLEPSDIVVLTPDIESYAPFVEAVFGVDTGRQRIPYRVVRGRAQATDEVVLAFDALLDVLAGRMGASAVLDLLDLDVVRQRFDVAPGELETLRGWVVESGIRWAADAEHRAEVGQPALEDNSWRFGLDRMLLGYASEGDGTTLFGGCLPCPVAEGGAADLLGKLAELCARLSEFRVRLRDPRPVAAWRVDLCALFEAMIAANARTTPQLQGLRTALADLADDAKRADFEQAIELSALRRRLAATMERRLSARGFLAGGVTFCPLVPMRAVPFRVVCLLGMNDEVFPRRSPALGFDLVARDHMAGDRSVREDDRYAFLEAILSARERLLVTYTGQGVQDNRTIPPSVVVSELLDVMRASFEPVEELGDGIVRDAEPDAIERRLVVRHRLHAFSPAYFRSDGDPRLFSFAAQYFESARTLGAERRDPSFLAGPLRALEPAFELSLDELEALLMRPVQTLLERHLGLSLGRELDPLADREPIDIGSLADWQLGDELLARVIEGRTQSELWPALRASGKLPLGTPGRIEFDKRWPTVGALAAAAHRYRASGKLDPLDVSLEVEGARITGTLRDLFSGAHFCVSYSKVGALFELRHWIRHVVLCCALELRPRRGVPSESLALARHKDGDRAVGVRFARPERPFEVMAGLVELARAARSAPLPLFRRASRDYGERVFNPSTRKKSRGPEEALWEAEKLFASEHDGDLDDPYVALVFDRFERATTAEPIDFATAAEMLYAPFFAHRSVK